jgi:hypothetical protein
MTEPIHAKRTRDLYADRHEPKPIAEGGARALSDGDLERATASLRSQVSKPVNYPGRAQDEADLATLENEGARRDVEALTQARAGVAICKRPANLPVIGPYVEHWWIRTSTKEMGMGNNDGSLPGNEPPNDRNTKLVDHNIDHPLRCDPVADVDEACVNRELQEGKPTGKWTPVVNDCHTVVNDVLDKCRKVETQSNKSGADAGAPIAGAP